MAEEKIEEVDLNKIQNQILNELVNSGVITKQGIRVMGNGIIINKLDEMVNLNKQILNSLYHLESKIKALKV